MPRRHVIWILSSFFAFALPLQAQTPEGLIGSWRGGDGFEVIELLIQSSSITVDGDQFSYRMDSDTIYIDDDGMTLPFPYLLDGDKLQVNFSVIGGGLVLLERQDSGGNSAKMAPSPGNTSTSEPKANTTPQAGEVGEPSWGFLYRPAAGWQTEPGTEYYTIARTDEPGAIFVLPHDLGNRQDLQAKFSGGFQSEEYQLQPVGDLSWLSDTMIAADFQGTLEGYPVQARGIGTLSPFEGGAYIVAVIGSGQMTPDLAGAAEQLAGTFRYLKVDRSALGNALAGHWGAVSSQTSRLWLEADGSFQEYSEFVASGNFEDSYGDVTGNWGVGSSDENAGRWTARGNERKGTITLNYNNGQQRDIEYEIWVENGTTYWKECLFDGARYTR